MKVRTVTKQELAEHPFKLWNAFVDLLAMENYDDLAQEQRPAHLVFWYESEVQNGGHLQYFENRGTKHLSETISALGDLGAACQQNILRNAANMLFSRHQTQFRTVEEFSVAALEGKYEEMDTDFHKCSPSLMECLEAHLGVHASRFVVIV
jgi:hypothetical protein